MNVIPPENRRVINPSNPLFNQFPLPAVTAVDYQTLNTRMCLVRNPVLDAR